MLLLTGQAPSPKYYYAPTVCQTLPKTGFGVPGATFNHKVPRKGQVKMLVRAHCHLWGVQALSPRSQACPELLQGLPSGGVLKPSRLSQAGLPPRIFCDGTNVLDLHCPLVTCGCWSAEMWLVQLWGYIPNLIFIHVGGNSHTGLAEAGLGSRHLRDLTVSCTQQSMAGRTRPRGKAGVPEPGVGQGRAQPAQPVEDMLSSPTLCARPV